MSKTKRAGRVNFRCGARGAWRQSGGVERAPATRARAERVAAAADVRSGLWETETVENYEAFLVACGARAACGCCARRAAVSPPRR